jgi:hypothetical protein
MAGTLRVRRSRGALSGFLLVLLGIWGALVPLAGPYFHFAYTPDTAWHVTSGLLLLEVLPGACAFIGGIIVLASRLRPVAVFGAWLAALSGAWFAVGGVLIGLWSHGISAGQPVGGRGVSVAEQISFFAGLGIVIVFVAALALGRLTVVAARDIAQAEEAAAEQAAADQAVADEAASGRIPAAVPAVRRPAAASAEPGRKPVRAILTRVASSRSAAAQAAAGKAAAGEAAADNAAAEEAADQQAADAVGTR